ncbi:ActS/PrrB/RegB family redox-sensitive histidine kinase [uncultured Enterovirga sp.]|uniref:ActS/PrrB/RegB family redox-sensitive histidine kinase n=1 Tax=uncultured Enterovirga sp. TaxID=2026352 RepID=UPI0035CC9EAE
MRDLAPVSFGREARRLKLDTIVRLRWLAVTGQCLAVSVVHLHLGYRLPFLTCLAVIAAAAAVNLWITLREPASHRLAENPATALLAFDIVQLAALLYLTGGLQNPFAVLFLAPVLISAASLSPMRTLGLGLLAAFSATILARLHLPLPWSVPGGLVLPDVYVAGIWTAILLAIAFTAGFAYRVAEEARQLGEALAATEFVLAREQHLSQLDGLAAAAAHELGTPLATIRLVAKELDLQAEPGSAMAEDTRLLRDEVERCRVILSKLTSLGDEEGHGFLATMSLGHVIEEVVEPQRSFDVEFVINRTGDGPEPVCRRSPGLMFSLGNLVDNAAGFAQARILIEARWNAEIVSIEIRDDGPGFASEVLLRVGEPYVTTRGHNRDEEGGGGLGLGLFIAKTLIERSGAQLTLWNAGPPNGGAVARIMWPRAEFERGVGRSSTDLGTEALSQAEPLPI